MQIKIKKAVVAIAVGVVTTASLYYIRIVEKKNSQLKSKKNKGEQKHEKFHSNSNGNNRSNRYPFSLLNFQILIVSILAFLANEFLLKKTFTDNILVEGYFNDVLATILLFAFINLLISIIPI